MGNKSSRSAPDNHGTGDSGLVVRPIEKSDFSKGTSPGSERI
jgi:hypothetical protein